VTRGLARWLLVSAALQLACALLLGGRLHPDEIHQWIEPAWRWIWHYGTRSQEWYLGLRNVLGPGLVAAVVAPAHALRLSAPLTLAVVHVVTALASLRALVALHAHLVRRTSAGSAELAVALLACSVPFANLAFRPMGESLSLVAALCALAAFDAAPFRLGLWLGAAFVLRYPSGLLIVAPALALLLRRDPRAVARALVGLALPLAALGLADRLFWGAAFHSVRAYLQFNLVDDRARLDFGARPAWFYLACLPLLVPAGAWLALGSLDRRRLGLAAATAAVYLAGMSAIAHKEFRFALVAVPLVTAALVAARPAWTPAQRRGALALTAAQSAVALAVLYLSGYCQGDPMRVARWVGGRGDLRELVLLNVAHPGLSTLGRDVPVWGDRREHCAATAALVAARGRGWCPPGRYLICDERRDGCFDEAMRAEGCAVVARRGRAVAIARAASGSAASQGPSGGIDPVR
jgi:hypothetical protein